MVDEACEVLLRKNQMNDDEYGNDGKGIMVIALNLNEHRGKINKHISSALETREKIWSREILYHLIRVNDISQESNKDEIVSNVVHNHNENGLPLLHALVKALFDAERKVTLTTLPPWGNSCFHGKGEGMYRCWVQKPS